MTEHPPSDEALVIRYARLSDQTALEELLARHFENSFQIALRCLKDPAAADDCVQEAFVTMIRVARRFDSERSFRPWWEGILWNTIRQERRKARRRRGYEQRYAQSRPSSHKPAPEGELLREEVHEHIGALPDGLRSALVLHYYQGKTHGEVARVLGWPQGTVSGRIRRGLEELRGRLSAAGYPCAIVELDATLSTPIKHTAPPPTPARAALEAAAWRAATRALISKAVLGLAAILVSILALRATDSQTPSRNQAAAASNAPEGRVSSLSAAPASGTGADPAKGSVVNATEPTGAKPPLRTPRPIAAPRARAASGFAATTPPDQAWLRVRLIGELRRSRGPVALRIRRQNDALRGPKAIIEAKVTADSAIDLAPLFQTGPPPSSIVIAADHPAFLPRELQLPFERGRRDPRGALSYSLDLELQAAAVITGRVFNGDGLPLAGASVQAFRGSLEAAEAASTDSKGRYRLKAEGPGTLRLVARAKRWRAATAELTPRLAAPTSAPDLQLSGGQEISGRVMIRGFGPAQGLQVRATRLLEAGHRPLGKSLLLSGDTIESKVKTATVDASGHYRLEGLARGRYRLQLRSGGAHRLHGSTLRAAGRPVQNAPAADVDFEIAAVKVRFEVEAARADELRLMTLSYPGNSQLQTFDDALELRLAPGVPYRFHIRSKGSRPVTIERRFLPTDSDQVIPVTLEAEARAEAQLIVNLKTADGSPVEDATFELRRRGRGYPDFLKSSGRAGRFEVNGAPTGDWALLILPGARYSRSFLAAARIAIRIDELMNRELTCTLVRGGRLRLSARDHKGRLIAARCRVLDDDGAPLLVAFVTRGEGSIGTDMDELSAFAPGEVQSALPPGQYTVELLNKQVGEARVQVTIRAGELSEVDARLKPGAR